ncbi:MAG: phosphoribosylformylglycinamidine synthase subunit PurS [Deferribacteraceae bacterium]|jgi:phosphoribosylformylglycinamidine synthase|nr:phosphoribosylformylglycinamidine synthase subunit PurS [Deferribacteraceae bacterium]
MNIKVFVSLREGVLDPQGQAIREALNRTGYSNVNDVRVNKVFEISVSGSKDSIKADVEKFSKELLANPIIETFRIEWGE